MKKVYYLKTCDTCRRILKQLNLEGFELQEIKTDPISISQLEELKEMAGSYQALFSKRAKKYKEMGLKDQVLTEPDFKHYLLDDYTFLKRPVLIDGQNIFIGNDKKTVAKLVEVYGLS